MLKLSEMIDAAADGSIVAGSDKIVSDFESKAHSKHTTHSWKFLSVVGPQRQHYHFPQVANLSDGVIGMLDLGFWPESLSFSGHGMTPAPGRWKGECTPGQNFTADLCNNKLIGAKGYHEEAAAAAAEQGISLSDVDNLGPRDVSVHGSHTASTAAGRLVPNISNLGIGQGDLSSGAPGARLAVYKVCWEVVRCRDADILKAFDDAIADGVDIISASVAADSGDSMGTHLEDSFATGSFHAARKNVLVSAAAENNGPGSSTTPNTAPWMLTVAASTTDRLRATNVQFIEGTIISGGWVANPDRLAQPSHRFRFRCSITKCYFSAIQKRRFGCSQGGWDNSCLSAELQRGPQCWPPSHCLSFVRLLQRLSMSAGTCYDRASCLTVFQLFQRGGEGSKFVRKQVSFEAHNSFLGVPVIGVLDSGFWPESPSFSGVGMLPAPGHRWKGVCTPGQNFTANLCNNKVIGARAYSQAAAAAAAEQGLSLSDFDILSPRDVSGHGSHKWKERRHARGFDDLTLSLINQ